MPLKLDSLELAVEALQCSLDAAERHAATEDAALRDTIRAGVIQNFEVAYELSWKFIQRWLRENLSPEDADYPRSRKELFRMAARERLIADPLPWFDFAEARNLTSHTYDVSKAESGFQTARRFLPHAKALLASLEAQND
jgi:nucleotidyltransferase substrate binding protein (TIGR01987 family)